ncbi:MAG: phosphodiester glycosidase family protein [Bacteroidota bacterium]
MLVCTGFRSDQRISTHAKDTYGILSHVVDPQTGGLHFYWKNAQNKPYGSLGALRDQLLAENLRLTFAMNGGMYQRDQSPLGLFVEAGKLQAPLNTTRHAHGNFYLQPNGVFYLTAEGTAAICRTDSFELHSSITYATHSGPMLVRDGALHPKFRKGSSNLHIRNGVGVLPDGRLLFAQSKQRINFFDFASFFQQRGCRNALYLDGFVSRTYLPAQQWEQLDGRFGVIIGEVAADPH